MHQLPPAIETLQKESFTPYFILTYLSKEQLSFPVGKSHLWCGQGSRAAPSRCGHSPAMCLPSPATRAANSDKAEISLSTESNGIFPGKLHIENGQEIFALLDTHPCSTVPFSAACKSRWFPTSKGRENRFLSAEISCNQETMYAVITKTNPSTRSPETVDPFQTEEQKGCAAPHKGSTKCASRRDSGRWQRSQGTS